MAVICEKCGASAGEKANYCSQCGTPLGDSPRATVPALPDNVVAALCYVLTFVTGLIFLNLDPYRRDKKVRFHAWQAIFFGGVWVGFSIVEKMLLHIFPFIWFLTVFVHLALFVLWILFMLKAYTEQKFELPVLSDLAQQQAAREWK